MAASGSAGGRAVPLKREDGAFTDAEEQSLPQSVSHSDHRRRP